MYCRCGPSVRGTLVTLEAGGIALLIEMMGTRSKRLSRTVRKAHIKNIGVGWGTILRYRKQVRAFFLWRREEQLAYPKTHAEFDFI